MKSFHEQKMYLTATMKMERNVIRMTEGEYKSEDEFDENYLIPVINVKNPQGTIKSAQLDKQRLVMAFSESVFSGSNSFLYQNLWKCDQNHMSDQINVYQRKVQYVKTVIEKSQEDIMICSLISASIIFFHYIF